jgi:DNA-binding response OmpR family regulator
MTASSLLEGKRILIVDDEPDVLAILEESLAICDVVKATTFEAAKALLESQSFDMAILDIMGVDGYQLLEIARRKSVIPVMLTAHALSPENVVKSYKGGAASYIPKEKMSEITTYLNDILEAKEKGKDFWWCWLDRFASFFEMKFGADWQKKDEELWEKLKYWG